MQQQLLEASPHVPNDAQAEHNVDWEESEGVLRGVQRHGGPTEDEVLDGVRRNGYGGH